MQQRHATGGRSTLRAAGILLLVAHLVIVGWLTLRPLDVPWVSPANLTPLAGIRADLALGREYAVRSIGKDLVILAPLGLLLPLAHGRLQVSRLGSFARTVAAGAFVSLAVELLQTGVPGRVVDVDSLWLNTIGVAMAHLAVVPVLRNRLRRRTGDGLPATGGTGFGPGADETHRTGPGQPDELPLTGAHVGLVP
ncbi:VanZ family protein [Streptomyces sp. NPDC060194]|uniref:VanZ family protein n=1 Tax=Streptomyces sp. NPDC060194 TaxID=3347069 RepID=UPI003655255F